MKAIKKEITVVVFVVVMMNLAVCERMKSGAFRREELEAAVARTKQQLQETVLHVEEHERHHQALLESMKEDNDHLLNVNSVLEVLHRISSTSTRNLRALTKGLKKKSDAALLEAQQEIEREEEEKALLQRRWWRAKQQLRRSQREQEAMDRATLHQAQSVATKIEAMLEEADRLRSLRHKIDLATERIRSHQGGRQEGILSRWRRRLSSLFHVSTSKAAKDTSAAMPNKPLPDDCPASLSPTHKDPQGYESVPLEDDNDQLPDTVDSAAGGDTEAEAPNKEVDVDDHTGGDSETEDLPLEDDPANHTGGNTDNDAEDTDAGEEFFPSDPAPDGISGSMGTDPSQAETGGASPKDLEGSSPKRSFMWLVFLHAGVSLAVVAVRVKNRDWRLAHY